MLMVKEKIIRQVENALVFAADDGQDAAERGQRTGVEHLPVCWVPALADVPFITITFANAKEPL